MNRRYICVLIGIVISRIAPLCLADPIQWSGNDHYYELMYVPSGMNWFDAKDAAMNQTYLQMDGYLATITSSGESDFITTNFHPSGAGNNDIWVGGYQDVSAPDYSEPSGGWRWVTDEPWDYTNWLGPEPNNGSPYGNEDGLMLNPVYSGRWNDARRVDPLAFYIVEYGPITPTSPIPAPGAVILGSIGLGMASLKLRRRKMA